jgi:hypothetical protein
VTGAEAEPTGARPFDAYPGLYVAADAAAVSLRGQHFLGEAILLILNPISAALVLAVALGMVRMQGAVLTAVSTTLLVLLLWVVRASRWQSQWYDCRGAAEDMKRITWRYLMQLDPFPPGEPAPDAVFVRALEEAVRDHPEVLRSLGRRAHVLAPPVTPEMRRIRQSSAEERAEVYLTSRVRPEAAWYAAKAERFVAADRRWFAGLILVQVAAVVSAIVLAVRVQGGGAGSAAADSWVPMLTAVGTALMGWQRSKRYADLAASYSGTAQKLAGLESARPSPEAWRAYLPWVERVEATLAQEHEAWRHMT